MDAPDAPHRMTPQERRAEIAAILARGIVRMHSRGALQEENSGDSNQKDLAFRPHTSPHVSTVNGDSESEKGER